MFLNIINLKWFGSMVLTFEQTRFCSWYIIAICQIVCRDLLCCCLLAQFQDFYVLLCTFIRDYSEMTLTINWLIVSSKFHLTGYKYKFSSLRTCAKTWANVKMFLPNKACFLILYEQKIGLFHALFLHFKHRN